MIKDIVYVISLDCREQYLFANWLLCVPYFKFRLNTRRICGKSEALAASRLIVRRDIAFCWNVFRQRRTNFLRERPLGKPMFHRLRIPSSRWLDICPRNRNSHSVLRSLSPLPYFHVRSTQIFRIWYYLQSVPRLRIYSYKICSYFEKWKMFNIFCLTDTNIFSSVKRISQRNE